MHFALLFLTLQLRAVPPVEPPPHPSVDLAADSTRDLARARNAQASFERYRRALLPTGPGGAGRCDVRLGRYCWWYDASVPTFPPEPDAIGRRRVDLLRELDRLGALHPGDDWISGLQVHYRVDGRDPIGADSVARTCRSTAWWCSALAGYAAHARGDAARADSAFSSALSAMPPDVACAWRSITPLLSADDRSAYEHQPCGARAGLERRYWLLSRPQLGTAANEWQNEFNVRRVLAWLGERSATPHLASWGNDAAELVLRYGWPVAWSRIARSDLLGADGGIVGHDPSPSFAFAADPAFGDSTRALRPDAWDLTAPRAEARYAPRLVRRVASVAAQIARFRRGDSTLVVAAFAAVDDSLLVPAATLGTAGEDGAVRSSNPQPVRTGHAQVMLAGVPIVAGVEIVDSVRRTLARVRETFAPALGNPTLGLSDLLLYRTGEEPAASLDSALAAAVPGDTVGRNRKLGLFWETYGLSPQGESVDLTVSVERVDRGWMRSARQRLGLAPVDTPIRVRWTDARSRSDGGAAHSVALDLGNVPPGRYRISLTVARSGEVGASAMREVELTDH